MELAMLIPKVAYIRASQTFLFCHHTSKKNFLCDPLVNSLQIMIRVHAPLEISSDIFVHNEMI